MAMEGFEPRKEGESLEDYAKRLEAEIEKLQKNKTEINKDTDTKAVTPDKKVTGVNLRSANKIEQKLGPKNMVKMNDYASFNDWWSDVGSKAADDFAQQQFDKKLESIKGNKRREEAWVEKKPGFIKGVVDGLQDTAKGTWVKYNMAARHKNEKERKENTEDTTAKRTQKKIDEAKALNPGEIEYKNDPMNIEGKYTKTAEYNKQREITENAAPYLSSLKRSLSKKYPGQEIMPPDTDKADWNDITKEYYAGIEDLKTGYSHAGRGKMTTEDWQKAMEESDEPFVIYPDKYDVKRHALTVRRGYTDVWHPTGPEEVKAFIDACGPKTVISGERTSTNKWRDKLQAMLRSGNQDYYYGDLEPEKGSSRSSKDIESAFIGSTDDSFARWTDVNDADYSNWADTEAAKKFYNGDPEADIKSPEYVGLKKLSEELDRHTQVAAKLAAVIPEGLGGNAQSITAWNSLKEDARKTMLNNYKATKASQEEALARLKKLKEATPERISGLERLLKKRNVPSSWVDDFTSGDLSPALLRAYFEGRTAIDANKTDLLKVTDIANIVKNKLVHEKDTEDYLTDPERKAYVTDLERQLLPMLKALETTADGTSAKDNRNRIESFMHNLYGLAEDNAVAADMYNAIDGMYDLDGAEGLTDLANVHNKDILEKIEMSPLARAAIQAVHGKGGIDLDYLDLLKQNGFDGDLHAGTSWAGAGKNKIITAGDTTHEPYAQSVFKPINDYLTQISNWEQDAEFYNDAEKMATTIDKLNDMKSKLSAYRFNEDKKEMKASEQAATEYLQNAKANEKRLQKSSKERKDIKGLRSEIASLTNEIKGMLKGDTNSPYSLSNYDNPSDYAKGVKQADEEHAAYIQQRVTEDKTRPGHTLPQEYVDRLSDTVLPSQVDVTDEKLTNEGLKDAAKKYSNLNAAKKYSDLDTAFKEAERNKGLSKEELKPIIDALNNKW